MLLRRDGQTLITAEEVSLARPQVEFATEFEKREYAHERYRNRDFSELKRVIGLMNEKESILYWERRMEETDNNNTVF